MLLPTEPEPTPARREAVVAEFLRSAGDLPGAAAVARLIVEFAAIHDPGDLVRVSPGRWEAFLFEWLPRSSGPVPPDEVAAVVRAWSAWAVHTNPLSEAAREHMARLLDELLEEFAA